MGDGAQNPPSSPVGLGPAPCHPHLYLHLAGSTTSWQMAVSGSGGHGGSPHSCPSRWALPPHPCPTPSHPLRWDRRRTHFAPTPFNTAFLILRKIALLALPACHCVARCVLLSVLWRLTLKIGRLWVKGIVSPKVVGLAQSGEGLTSTETNTPEQEGTLQQVAFRSSCRSPWPRAHRPPAPSRHDLMSRFLKINQTVPIEMYV